MIIKLLGLAAAAALCTSVASAQTSQKQPARTTTSSGEVSASVPQAAIEAQKDAQLIGSPAWWATHSTADGKPLSAEGTRKN